MHELPSGTVTFLFTDIEGSTKLAQAHPDKWEMLRARHHAILKSAMESHNGYVFQIIGDAFCTAFHTASDALRAAVKSQIDLHNEDWGDTPIKVRMGINTGTAQVSEDMDHSGGYKGYTSMARAQRLTSAAHGGQVLISLATEELVRDELPEGISLRDMGERRLKDLIRPEHIYQLVISNLSSEFPPLKTLDAYRHNLPTQTTTFIGREKEMAEVAQAIHEHRLVTLTGSGGTGKTRLSLQVAADLLDQFPNGVWFVELASLTNPDLIPQTILSAFGVPEQPGQTILQSLLGYLHERQLLLILDNCEHLIEASARLAETLLKDAPALKILATSREPLGVKGEADWRVPSLSLPDLKHLPVIEQISQYEAVQLFVDRALLVQPHFNVTKDNAPGIAQICFRLDGIPLALELAAARMRALSVGEIAARLDDRFRLLTGGARTALPRQQTLRAAIDWSYNLLSEQERELLRRLAVFSGGWTLKAAEQVCNIPLSLEGRGDRGDGQDILDLLTHLVDKSLVIMDQSANRSRYRLLETTRQYAREKLFDSEEGSGIRDGHLAYFLGLAEQAEANIHGADQVEWMDRLEGEYDNFRAALEWSVSARKTELALRLLGALAWTWGLRAHFSETRSWFEKIRSLPEVGNYTIQYATLLNAIGFSYWESNDLREGHSLLEESWALWLKLGTDGEPGLAWSIMLLGAITSVEGDRDTAKSLLEQSLELFQKHGDQRGEAECFLFLAIIAVNLRDPDFTLVNSLYERSLAIFRRLGDLYGIGYAIRLLGVLFAIQGNYESAQLYLKQSIEIQEKLQHKAGMCLAFWSAGEAQRWKGDLDGAEQYYEKILTLAREYGLKEFIVLYYGCEGMLALQRNDYPLAHQYFSDEIDIGTRSEMPISYYDFLALAALAAGTNQPECAAKLLGLFQASDYWNLDEAECERHIQIAREQLGEAAFEAFVNEGRAMTSEQAIELVLRVVNEPPTDKG